MNVLKGLTRFEKILWGASIAGILLSSLLSANRNVLTIVASLIGVTALIFVAKGHTVGQILTVLFSLVYGWISVEYRYYGEMITYLFMTTPIAILSIISWIKNPYEAGRNEVKVAVLSKTTKYVLLLLTIIVTTCFYFVLRALDTENLLISTVSIATSFMASALMFCRSSGYALAYAANDIVLIVLWILATIENSMYLSMVVCFIIFLCNDIYGYYNWKKMKRRQELVFESDY